MLICCLCPVDLLSFFLGGGGSLPDSHLQVHPDDRNFNQLDIGLQPVPAASSERQMIKDYIANSQARPTRATRSSSKRRPR